jgi:hypothetical protein
MQMPFLGGASLPLLKFLIGAERQIDPVRTELGIKAALVPGKVHESRSGGLLP